MSRNNGKRQIALDLDAKCLNMLMEGMLHHIEATMADPAIPTLTKVERSIHACGIYQVLRLALKRLTGGPPPPEPG